MAKYLLHVNYIGEGIKGLLKDGGTKRRAVAEGAIKSLGGSMETFYFAFGDTDVYIICDMPNDESMAAVALTVSASGSVTVKTTVLLSAEEIDEAAKKTPHYTAPGK